jgi:transposase-like protein
VIQLCIVHIVRHSLNYVSWKRRKEVAADLRHIYQAATVKKAELHLCEFEARWDDDGAKLEARAEPIYHPVWGKDADELTLAPFT